MVLSILMFLNKSCVLLVGDLVQSHRNITMFARSVKEMDLKFRDSSLHLGYTSKFKRNVLSVMEMDEL